MSSRRRSVYELAVLVAVFLLAASCSARYDLVLRDDGSAEAALSASLEPLTARLVTNLAGFGRGAKAGAPAEPLLDAARLSQSLSASSGVSAVSLQNPNTRSVAGTVVVKDLERFLASPAAGGDLPAARFIRIERSGSGGRLTVSLDRASGATLLANLSPDIVDYVSALMAPIATGEDLGRSEYLDLVTAMYGSGIATEIAGAFIRASIDLPGPAVSARGGSISGRRAEFSVPLVDLLVLEKPILLEATWK